MTLLYSPQLHAYHLEGHCCHIMRYIIIQYFQHDSLYYKIMFLKKFELSYLYVIYSPQILNSSQITL